MTKYQRFLCFWLDWHVPGKNRISFDGASLASTCKRCNQRILQDSQGNWFGMGYYP